MSRIPFKSSLGVRGTIPAESLPTWLEREDAGAILLAYRRDLSRQVTGILSPMKFSYADMLEATKTIARCEEVIEDNDWYIRVEAYTGVEVPFVGGPQ